jgi:hypothetical protein
MYTIAAVILALSGSVGAGVAVSSAAQTARDEAFAARAGHKGETFVCAQKGPSEVAARCEWAAKGKEPRGF